MNVGPILGGTVYPEGGPPRRHWVIVVLLLLILVLVTAAAVDQRDPNVVLVIGPFIVAGTAGLLTRRLWGYRVAVGVSVLLALLGLLVVLTAPEAPTFVALAVMALPLLILISPASRRWARAQRAAKAKARAEAEARAAAADGLPWPAGWTRRDVEGRGWFSPLMAVTGTLVLILGIGLALGNQGEAGMTPFALAIASYGGLMLAAVPPFARRRGGRPQLADLPTATGTQRCLRFPVSRLRLAGALGVLAFLLLSGVGLLYAAIGFLYAGGAGPEARGIPWGVLVIGVLSVAVGGIALVVNVVFVRRGLSIELTPTEVRTGRAGPVPWERVALVHAELSLRSPSTVEPIIALVLHPAGSSLFRTKIPAGRRRPRISQKTISVRLLSVEPRLLYYALRWYHRHPEARGELADERSVDRVQRRDLGPHPGLTHGPGLESGTEP